MTAPDELIPVLSVKLGTVLLMIGAIHLANLLIFGRIKRNAVLVNSMRTRPSPTDAIPR